MKINRTSLVALILALCAIAVSAYISENIYERLPHIEDEFAFLWQAQVMAQGEIALDSPPEHQSLLVPFVVDHNGLRFGKYPPGWPATLSLGARIGQPWLVQALLWSGVVWLTYRLGSKIVSPGVGLLAAGLTLSSPMFFMLSGTLMSHGLSTFLGLAFLLSMMDLLPAHRHRESPAPRILMVGVAGGCLGLLGLTRPLTAIAFSIPILVLCATRLKRDMAEEGKTCVLIGVQALVIAGLVFVWQWALTGDPWRNPYTLWWPYDRLGFGPGIGVTESGHNLFWALYNTRFSLATGVHDLFGWPWLSWILLPFGLLGLRWNRDAWICFSTFPSLVVAYGFYWVGSWLFGPRYYVESLPALAVISAAGFFWIVGNLRSGRSRVRIYVSVALLTILVTLNLVYYVPARLGGMRGLYQISREPIGRLNQINLGRALVLVDANRWFEYAPYLLLTQPYKDSELLVAWSPSRERDQVLVQTYDDYEIFRYDPQQPEVLQHLRSP